MAQGRKKTAAQHKAAGTYRKGRHATPKVETAKPRKPRELKDRAATWWERLAPALAERQMVAPVDATALSLLCQALADYDEAQAWLAKHGPIAYTHNGSPVQSPWVAIRNTSRDAAIKLLRKFGLTPLDRTGLAPQGGDNPGDALAALLSSRGSPN